MNFNFLNKYLCVCTKLNHSTLDDADEDNNGRLSLKEFFDYFVNVRGKPPTNEQWFKFHLADRDNDGFITKQDILVFEQHNNLFA